MTDSYNEPRFAVVKEFAEGVVEQNAAIERHDPTTPNEFPRKYINASESLINAGADGIATFASLLKDKRDAVRVMAASFHQENSAVLHVNPNAVPSGIDRAAFDS